MTTSDSWRTLETAKCGFAQEKGVCLLLAFEEGGSGKLYGETGKFGGNPSGWVSEFELQSLDSLRSGRFKLSSGKYKTIGAALCSPPPLTEIKTLITLVTLEIEASKAPWCFKFPAHGQFVKETGYFYTTFTLSLTA